MGTRAARRRPLPPLAGLLLAVLLAHAWLLAGLPLGPGEPVQAAVPTLRVRQIELQPPLPTAAAAKVQPAGASLPRPRPLAPRPDRPPVMPADPAAVADGEVRSSEPVDVEEQALPVEAAEGSLAAMPSPAASTASTADAAYVVGPGNAPALPPGTPLTVEMVSSGGQAPPVYPTRLPGAATLRYELRRGPLTGEGSLHWEPGPDRYELRIEGRAFGVPILGWISRGGFDAAGLAPLRFVDRRRGRDLRAASFQRDRGVISWSTSTAEAPLLAGAQDRVSWIVQLAAIVEADPVRFEPGQRVVMQVAGARGDVDAWVFGVVAREKVELQGGKVESALRLRREPRKPFDTVVDVWLDPARSHLPARLKLTAAGGGDGLEFVLRP